MKRQIFLFSAATLAMFSVLAACSLFEGETTTTTVISATTTTSITDGVFVSSTGNDANDGLTPATALATIEAGVDTAVLNGISGVYVSGNLVVTNEGVTLAYLTNLTISGGWNSSFTFQSGISVLDGRGQTSNVLKIYYFTNVTVEGFNCVGGVSDDNGSGAYLYWGSDSTILLSLMTNVANRGAIYADSLWNTTLYLHSVSNYATAVCAAGELRTLHGCTVSLFAEKNYGAIAAGGFGIYSSSNTTVLGRAENNFANGQGIGGCVFYFNQYCTFDVDTISNRSVATYGTGTASGAEYGYMTNCTVSGDAIDNVSEGAIAGGGVGVMHSVSNTFSGTIIGNSTERNGGGIFFLESSDNVILSSAVISNNTADSGITGSYSGGGIYNDSTPYTNFIQVGAVYSPNFVGNTGVSGGIEANIGESLVPVF